MSRPLHAVGAAVTPPHDHKHGSPHHDHNHDDHHASRPRIDQHDHGHHDHHDHGHGHDASSRNTATSMPRPGAMRMGRSREELAGPGGWQRGLSAIVAVGLRPCSGAILVLVFALAQGMFWAGVAATFVMGLGTAITVAAIATLAVGCALGWPGTFAAPAPATACWRCAASRSAPPPSCWLSARCCSPAIWRPSVAPAL